MELPREWQPEPVVLTGAVMDWVEHEAVHLAPRVEVQPPVVRLAVRLVAPVAHLERVLVRPLEAARPEVGPADRAVRPELLVRPELARPEAEPWGPTYRVIRRYPPRIEAWEPVVRVVAVARQQPWARRTRPVRTVKRKR